MSFFWPEEGDFPENLRHVFCVVINKRSFESGSYFRMLAGIVSDFVSFFRLRSFCQLFFLDGGAQHISDRARSRCFR